MILGEVEVNYFAKIYLILEVKFGDIFQIAFFVGLHQDPK